LEILLRGNRHPRAAGIQLLILLLHKRENLERQPDGSPLREDDDSLFLTFSFFCFSVLK